jgi:hypothetical protein
MANSLIRDLRFPRSRGRTVIVIAAVAAVASMASLGIPRDVSIRVLGCAAGAYEDSQGDCIPDPAPPTAGGGPWCCGNDSFTEHKNGRCAVDCGAPRWLPS